jgi:hypothetical protein
VFNRRKLNTNYKVLNDAINHAVLITQHFFFLIIILLLIQYVYRRMEHPDMDKQQAVLGWLQILCHLGVTIPLDILFNMFTTGRVAVCIAPGKVGQWGSGVAGVVGWQG